MGSHSWAETLDSTCEKLITERLLSPSSYKRIDSQRSDEAVENVQEYINMHEPLKSGDTALYAKSFFDINKNGKLPTKVTIDLTYDASNVYGALLRERSECVFVQNSDDLVDGRSAPEFQLHRLKIAPRTSAQ